MEINKKNTKLMLFNTANQNNFNYCMKHSQKWDVLSFQIEVKLSPHLTHIGPVIKQKIPSYNSSSSGTFAAHSSKVTLLVLIMLEATF